MYNHCQDEEELFMCPTRRLDPSLKHHESHVGYIIKAMDERTVPNTYEPLEERRTDVC